MSLLVCKFKNLKIEGFTLTLSNIHFDSSTKELFILCKPRTEDFDHGP